VREPLADTSAFAKNRAREAEESNRKARGKLKQVTEQQKRQADNSEALAWN
jgi:hypothetical protein